MASIDGEASHRVVELAVRALVGLTHRGAVSADAGSGDGAGLTIQIPHTLLAEDAAHRGLRSDELDRLGVAMVFLPAEAGDRAGARKLLEAAAQRSGIDVLGWRTVPVDPSMLGGVALESLPGIEQLLLAKAAALSSIEFERVLYLARRRAEAAYRENGVDAYIVSMSARTVVYKGLMVAPELRNFYPDLADERTRSALALFHQRFATNTLPNWASAQPFRFVAHNGEINTVLGNRNWMAAREPELTSPVWGEKLQDLIPVLGPAGSDTASLDEVLELLTASGRDVLHAMAMLVPDAWENIPDMEPQLRAFYEYHACLMEPWDGPAATAFTDGVVAAAAMDRNGLRPARYQVTSDRLVVLSSEVGMLGLPLKEIVESGRVGPGEMIAVDTAERRFLRNDDIKLRLSMARPYGRWVQANLQHLESSTESGEAPAIVAEASEVPVMQALHGYTKEEIRDVLMPMARDATEAIGSMGDDTPMSALNGSQRSLYSFFRQRFAQVTNPPIDSIRERIVMSLDTYLGERQSILDEKPEAARLLHLRSPVVSAGEWASLRRMPNERLSFADLRASFPVADGVEGLTNALDDLCEAAASAVDEGHSALVISDRFVDDQHAPIPMLLAVASVHHHLIRTGRRMRASILAEAGDARDVHHLAALIGFGASVIYPYLALETVGGLADAGKLGESDREQARQAYLRAAEAGILKVMSKMGISAVSSYHGAQIFEALGVGEEVVERSFPGTTSRIGGIGFRQIAEDAVERHERAFSDEALERGGWYKFRRDSDYHANGPQVWRALHAVVQGGGKEEYRAYSDLVHSRPPTALRDLLEFASDRDSIDIERVESVDQVLRRFQTGAMSLGALSREAHEDVARAMNKIGGLANTGEGGEDSRRYAPDGDRRDANSAIKQVASGRFGVTPAYLAGAQQLEIKMAQGSKPGEGGQLPGHKVTPYIASLRHVMPGTPLISPPPHHDIYSIEDLAQLIYDLKTANPRAKVAVKLVSSEGVGTIAAGVAKAYADTIQISGPDGGTGASPLSSIKYAGSPWELGLAETQQTLVMNGLRGRVTLAVDGGLHTGRDVVMAALLGADRFGFGTTALIAIGCKMARQCHSNTCPVGIATQAEDLRKKYFGTPEMLISFLTYVAEEVREILAELGFERLEDLMGHADLLRQRPAVDDHRWSGVDLSKLIAPAAEGPQHCVQDRNDRPGTTLLDDQILERLGSTIEDGTPFKGSYGIENTDRTVGGRISVRIAGIHGNAGLPDGTIDLNFSGSAGQSFGAWLTNGVHLRLVGEANDYVAKGMGGGEISIGLPAGAEFQGRDAALVGNTVLYGATGGYLFIAGRAGERFAVRNSGGVAVVEGVGEHGCEYMTEGIVVVLGEAGRNFGAGMSGGLSFVLDPRGDFPTQVNREFVTLERTSEAGEVDLLKALIERHEEETGSVLAREILNDWPVAVGSFWTVAPNSVAMEEGRADIVLRQLEVLQQRISATDATDTADVGPLPGSFEAALVEPPNAP